MFKKKKPEVTLDGLSSTILENLIRACNDYSKRITQDKNSPFNSTDENIIMTELLMLTFWNLKYLNYPDEIYNAVSKHYLNLIEGLKADRDMYSKLIEIRVKLYFDTWKDTNENMSSFISAFLQNINKNIMFDSRAQHLITTFFTTLNDANLSLLKTIKEEMKIVL